MLCEDMGLGEGMGLRRLGLSAGAARREARRPGYSFYLVLETSALHL
jgi:hypothetical protein